MAFTPTTKITQQDLQVFPSERLTDNADGGGMPLGTSITGEANELFNPISSIARVNGGFYTRLVYAGVMRADDEPLIGAYMAITKPPKDVNVSYVLFKATKYGELRGEIIKRIESYSVASIESRMTLLSTQSQYSKIIQTYQRVGEPLPLVGDVYCLRQHKAGHPRHEQYVKVVSVDAEDRTFTSPRNEEFKRTVVKLEISAKLNADFVGAEYPAQTYYDAPCKLLETNVVDAGQYYGIKPVSAAIAKNSASIKVPSLMERLVPTNQAEVRLSDLTAAGTRQTLYDAARGSDDGVISFAFNKTHRLGEVTTIYLGNAAVPKSIIITTNSGNITDTGGQLMFNGNVIGSVDYARCEAVINVPTHTGWLGTVKFRPAAAALQVADTTKIDISVNNRSYNYVLTISPPPAAGSVLVSYRSQGRWYDLRDDGTGKLVGLSAAHGSGSINLVTGTLSISCGELPDVGSSILILWGNTARYFNRSGGATKAKMLLTLSKDADPASISLSWNDGVAKTATCNAAGDITGAWTGKYDVQTRQIRIDTGANFNHPAAALAITASYSHGVKTHSTFNAPARDAQGKVTLSLGNKPIKPNTCVIRHNLLVSGTTERTRTLRDNGAGKLLDESNKIVGTIDYAARTALFDPSVTVPVRQATYTIHGFGVTGGGAYTRVIVRSYEYQPATVSLPTGSSGIVDVWFYDTSPTSTTTEQLSSGDIEIDLLPNHAEVVAPASVNVRWGQHRYFDKLNAIYTDLNPATGTAVLAGSIDYKNGKIVLKKWRWTNGAAPVITSLATSVEGNPVDAVTFRTPASPIRPESLQLTATALDDTAVTAIAGTSGELTAAHIKGSVDAEYGVVTARFGQLVTAAGKENEAWYSADAVDANGKIWQPTHVFAESITYNAVAYSYLPIDSSVVKINTVRLPQDGRVPIFRRGDTILISNAQDKDLGSAHTGGQTVQLGRTGLDRICITDASDKPVNAQLWDYDLDAGSITWKTPLDLSAYKMPLKAKHVQEERNRILKADIDGTLSLIFPTKRAYPLSDTYVSSVLIGGDLQVRVSIPFTQRNWDAVWRDEPNGEQLLNKLNLKDYPMVLTDDGAIKERWMIKFTSGSQFELYGETLGFVVKTDTLTDLAPINPATKKPYFKIPKQAFGDNATWAMQDVIRFNTWGTLLPVWVLCAVQPSTVVPKGEDGFTQCLYGDTTTV